MIKTWQPIETAPKDGTHIMLTNGACVSMGSYVVIQESIREIRDTDGHYIDQDESDGYIGWMDYIGGMLPEPTHWMPLPKAPEQGHTREQPAPDGREGLGVHHVYCRVVTEDV